MTHEDKGKTTTEDQSDLMGVKPFGSIGSDRTQNETKSIVDKLKKKRAEGSTQKTGEKANVGEVSSAIGNFVNRK